MTDKHQSMENSLKKLRLDSPLDSKKKQEILTTIKKHARQGTHKKAKRTSWIYLSTAAVIMLCGIFIYSIIIGNEPSNHSTNTNTGTNPVGEPETDKIAVDKEEQHENKPENDEQELNESPETEGRPARNGLEEELTVTKGATREGTVILEGMEEPELFTAFTLEPYGIHFEIADFLANYEVMDDTVRFYSDNETAAIFISVRENTNIDNILRTIKEQYMDNEPAQEVNLPYVENGYIGISQSFYNPPEGYYLYEIEGNVLVIQYQYGIEGGDGMEPRLEALRKSIQ